MIFVLIALVVGIYLYIIENNSTKEEMRDIPNTVHYGERTRNFNKCDCGLYTKQNKN